MINPETQMLVSAFEDNLNALGERVLTRDPWEIPAIVNWELAQFRQHGRVQLDLDRPDFLPAMARLDVWPIDWEVARASTRLDFRSDPADEIIAATSLVHGVPLLTRDPRLLDSKLVPLV